MQGFNRLTKWTIGIIYLVILAGAIVRMTGSGMGCPDWPKCFGEYIPPTSAEELPADYLEVYSVKRRQKNEKLASYLEQLGFTDLANKIAKDKSVYEEENFNVVKTYIEYLNRLIGAISGFFLLGLFIWSIRLRKIKPSLFWLSGFLLLAILVQAWFGSIVVSTNLLPGTISVHMFLALLIVVLLLHLEKASSVGSNLNVQIDKTAFYILGLVLILSLIQIIMGTQVRQEIDVIARNLGYADRSAWIESLSSLFLVHRSFSLLVLGLNLWLAFHMRKLRFKSSIYMGIVAILLVEILTGVVMAYFEVPRLMQASHLILASIALGWQYYIFINLRRLQPI